MLFFHTIYVNRSVISVNFSNLIEVFLRIKCYSSRFWRTYIFNLGEYSYNYAIYTLLQLDEKIYIPIYF